MRAARPIVLAILLAVPSLSLAGFVADLQAGAAYDDDVDRAEREADRRGAASLDFAGSAGERFVIGRGGSLALIGTIESAEFSDLDGLDRWAPGASVSYRQKTRLGARAPWVQVSGSAAFQDYRDGNRKGWIYETKVRYGWAAGERLSFVAGGAWLLRSAAESVFDRHALDFSLRADISLREDLSFYAAYQVSRGDVTSSSRPDLAVLSVAKERAPDPVFGSAFIVYRIEATSHDLHVGINYALGRHASLDLAWEGLLAEAAGGIEYGVNQFRGSFLYRF